MIKFYNIKLKKYLVRGLKLKDNENNGDNFYIT